jgi:type IV secretion system protein VirB5
MSNLKKMPRKEIESAMDKDDVLQMLRPYILGRENHDELYSAGVKRAANWRAAFFIMAMLALVSSVGSLMLYKRAHLVPYVVAVDSLGRVVAQGPVQETSVQNGAVVKAAIYDFVTNLRQIVVDQNAEHTSINKVYSMVSTGSAAQRYINGYYMEHSPFERAETESVTVDVATILPVSDTTYEVTWAEKVYTHTGMLVPSESHHYKGSFTFAINAPKDEQISRLNPLGVYITDASWTVDLIQDSNTNNAGKAEHNDN